MIMSWKFQWGARVHVDTVASKTKHKNKTWYRSCYFPVQYGTVTLIWWVMWVWTRSISMNCISMNLTSSTPCFILYMLIRYVVNDFENNKKTFLFRSVLLNKNIFKDHVGNTISYKSCTNKGNRKRIYKRELLVVNMTVYRQIRNGGDKLCQNVKVTRTEMWTSASLDQ